MDNFWKSFFAGIAFAILLILVYIALQQKVESDKVSLIYDNFSGTTVEPCPETTMPSQTPIFPNY